MTVGAGHDGNLITKRQVYYDAGNYYETTYAYDTAGNVTSVIFPLGNRILYTFDGSGNVSTVQFKKTVDDGTPKNWIYGWGSNARLTSLTDPNGNAWSYVYDGNGNRLSVTGPGLSISGSYDAQDRLLSYDGATYTYNSQPFGHSSSGTFALTEEWLGEGLNGAGGKVSHALVVFHYGIFPASIDRLAQIGVRATIHSDSAIGIQRLNQEAAKAQAIYDVMVQFGNRYFQAFDAYQRGDMANVPEFTDGNFESEVLNNAQPVLVDFWAPWCGPCHAIAPHVEALANEMSGQIRAGKLNVDDHPQTAGQFGIRSIPTLLLFRDGRLVDRLVGVQPRGAIDARLRALV